MSVPTYFLALCLASASVPSPHRPITPGPLAPAPTTGSQLRLTRQADRLVNSGSVVLISSGLAWGVMFGAMIVGARDRRMYNGLVAGINAAERPPSAGEREMLAERDRQGLRSNRDAIVGAVVGAALTIVGAALFGRGLALRKRGGSPRLAGRAPPGL